MGSLTVIPRLGIILLMIAMGAGAKWAGVLDREGAAVMNRLTFHLFLPLLVFCSICNSLDRDSLVQAGLGLGIAVAIHLGCYLLSFPYARLLRLSGPTAGVHQFSLVFSNAAFVGLPIVQALWGPEAMPVMSVFIVLFSLFNHTLGAFVLSGGGGGRGLREVFLTPPLVGALLGVAAAMLRLPIPAEIFSGLQSIGAVTTPLAMVALGCTLASTDLRGCFTDRNVYLTCLMRLVVLPVAVFLILRAVTTDYYLWAVPTLVCGMPCPSTLPILAQRYHADQDAAGRIIALSTLFAIVTIPLLSLFLLGR